MNITIIYDNRKYVKGWEKGWGFSALVENDRNEMLLFDTGDNPDKLMKNLKLSGVNTRDINALAFSHNHWDHKDGAVKFLKENTDAIVFIPENFPDDFIKVVESTGHRWILIGNKCNQIINDVYSTSLFKQPGYPQELGIVLKVGEVSALITGCAHPGILRMVEESEKIFKNRIEAVVGGFHLKGYTAAAVKTLIGCMREKGITWCAPCHCTGENQIKIFKEHVPGFMKTGSGRVITLKRGLE